MRTLAPFQGALFWKKLITSRLSATANCVLVATAIVPSGKIIPASLYIAYSVLKVYPMDVGSHTRARDKKGVHFLRIPKIMAIFATWK